MTDIITILIIGAGGREYMIGKSLNQSNINLYYTSSHKNPLLSNIAKYIKVESLENIDIIASIAKSINAQIVFPGGEAILANGIADACKKYNIECIGPVKELAQIETSKGFARNLCDKYLSQSFIPKYKIFKPNDKSYDSHILSYINNNEDFVIKADGLHGGKGVKLFKDHLISYENSIKYCEEIHDIKEDIIIEERLYGKEFSFMSFSDGTNLLHTIPVQDYKRAYENDLGPNTGSMGSITDVNGTLNFLSSSDITKVKMINNLVVSALFKEFNRKYKGILYGSYMKTYNGDIKIIEFNCRFGDPECINILSLMKTQFIDIVTGIVDSGLEYMDIKFSPNASVFKYAVPNGYPSKPIKNQLINFPITDNLILASVKEEDNKYYQLRSRALGYISVGNNITSCTNQVNEILDQITGPLFYRRDIGYSYSKITYNNCGVNIEEGNQVVHDIEKHVTSTFNRNVINKFGDFGGAFQLPIMNMPVLVSTTDGVGTKTIFVLNNYPPNIAYEMLGNDIVNHCINDILVKGAKPLFFLDYIASSKLNKNHISYFVKGCSEACKIANCVLIGGETAEMPDVYRDDHCDIVGTMVGMVEKYNMIDGKTFICKNDILIGLKSSGPHTNGYSLIRKVVDKYEKLYGSLSPDMIDKLSAPHKSYLKEYNLMINNDINIKGMCHITGGGFNDNLRRVIPDHLSIFWNKFEFSDPFKFIQKISNMNDNEMMEVFNCGIGMIFIVNPSNLDKLNKLDIEFEILGCLK